jgi:shikimate dehydrogenase
LTDRYAVIGNPVAHSRSPEIHAAFARQTGQDIEYLRLLAPLDGFAATVADFRAQHGRGANVTVPFKEAAFRLATLRSARAEAAGAANFLRFDDREIHCDNTDGIGLVRDLRDNLGVPLAGKRVLLIGAGGAARGVIAPLLEGKPAALCIVNRTEARAHALAASFSGVRVLSFAQLRGGRFDIVINATSASLAGEAPPVGDIYAGGALAYDLMYGKGGTPFLSRAAAAGARTADGLGMLVEQAAESFHLWRGVRPATQPVIETLRREL